MTTQKTVEQIILKSLLTNDAFVRRVLPHLKDEYFQERHEKVLFQTIRDYLLKYNQLPSPSAVDITLQNLDGVFEEDYKQAKDLMTVLAGEIPESSDQFLFDIAEKWCQEKALHNALLESISILDESDGKKEKRDKGMIPKILTDALGVSFDPNIGHDYVGDAEKRWEYYHKVEKKIPFDLEFFNKITAGGIPIKTLFIILAGTNVGKSLMMCHFAGAALMQGYNALYITLEMAEEKIARRIDANLLNIDIGELSSIPKDTYDDKITKLKGKLKTGKLVVKEYPTAAASSAHFRSLLNELKLKKQFVPDIIFIDYLNIAQSARIRPGSNVNSYTYVKAIAEELRGMAVEFGVPIVSATQTTRGGYGSSDPDLTDTSESFGLPATADFMVAITTSEELEKLGHLMVKQLKNRDNDVTQNKRFIIGVDRQKMRLFDVQDQSGVPTEQSAEEIYQTVGKKEDKPLNRFGVREGGAVAQAMKDWKFD